MPFFQELIAKGWIPRDEFQGARHGSCKKVSWVCIFKKTFQIRYLSGTCCRKLSSRTWNLEMITGSSLFGTCCQELNMEWESHYLWLDVGISLSRTCLSKLCLEHAIKYLLWQELIEIINNKARHNLMDATCRWGSDQLDGAVSFRSFREPLGQTKLMQIRQGETLNQ